MISLALTDHLEAPRDVPSGQVYGEVAALVRLADDLGVDYAFFAEHHAHAHYGHLPAPLLLALHLAAHTRRIQLGTAIICLNLHDPLDFAEQIAVAETLAPGRIAPGFGSGSTPEEFALFGQLETDDPIRHARFEEALELIIDAWRGRVPRRPRRFFHVPPHDPLPVPAPDLATRAWVAVNSVASARIAGRLGLNMLFSHLRAPDDYVAYRTAYRDAGGAGLVAANRPIHVGATDADALAEAEPALRTLWRRFRAEGKIPATAPEPADPADLCGHPLNFLVGSPQTVALRLCHLHAHVPFDVINIEPRWADLPVNLMHASLRRIAHDVRPFLP